MLAGRKAVTKSPSQSATAEHDNVHKRIMESERENGVKTPATTIPNGTVLLRGEVWRGSLEVRRGSEKARPAKR